MRRCLSCGDWVGQSAGEMMHHFAWSPQCHHFTYIWRAETPADSTDIRVAGTRWVWVDGHGWLTPNEARAAA